jgi:hypothetical protein
MDVTSNQPLLGVVCVYVCVFVCHHNIEEIIALTSSEVKPMDVTSNQPVFFYVVCVYMCVFVYLHNIEEMIALTSTEVR